MLFGSLAHLWSAKIQSGITQPPSPAYIRVQRTGPESFAARRDNIYIQYGRARRSFGVRDGCKFLQAVDF